MLYTEGVKLYKILIVKALSFVFYEKNSLFNCNLLLFFTLHLH